MNSDLTIVEANGTTALTNSIIMDSNFTMFASNSTSLPSISTLLPGDSAMLLSNSTMFPGDSTIVPSNSTLFPVDIETSYIADKTGDNCEYFKLIADAVGNGILMLFGLMGNTLTCAVVWRDRHKSSMSFLMINLAIVDDIVLLVWGFQRLLPALCNYIDGCWLYIRVSAPWNYYGWAIGSVVHMMATWSIVAITFVRFVSVCWPTKMMELTPKKVKVKVLIMLLLTAIFNIPRFLEKRIVVDPVTGDISMVFTKMGTSDTYQYFYKVALYYMFIYVIPLTLLIYYTYRLCVNLREFQKKREEMTSRSRDKAELTFSLVIVIVVFIVCQLMNPVRRVLQEVRPAEDRVCGTDYFYFNSISTLFVNFSSAVNFFIFCLCGKRFRMRLRELFRRGNKVYPTSGQLFTTNNQTNQKEIGENSLGPE